MHDGSNRACSRVMTVGLCRRSKSRGEIDLVDMRHVAPCTLRVAGLYRAKVELEIHKVLLSKQTNHKNGTKLFKKEKRYQNNALWGCGGARCPSSGTSERVPAVQTNGSGSQETKNKDEFRDECMGGGRGDSGLGFSPG